MVFHPFTLGRLGRRGSRGGMPLAPLPCLCWQQNLKKMMERGVMHALGWISGVNSNFGQVRLNATDLDGIRLRRLWGQTPMAKALEAGSEENIRSLVEGMTGFNFAMYRSCSEKIQRAITGEERFGEEHRIAIDFVLRTTELLRVRQLATETPTRPQV